jgi:hypothetical protein
MQGDALEAALPAIVIFTRSNYFGKQACQQCIVPVLLAFLPAGSPALHKLIYALEAWVFSNQLQ